MPHDHCAKELPREHIETSLNEVTHLFDGKDTITETPRSNDDLRHRMRSEKVHESESKTINFSTPMGLSFEHTRAIGARASEKRKSNGGAQQSNTH